LEEWFAGQDVVIDAAAPYSLNLLATRSEAERHPLEYAVRRTDRMIRALCGNDTLLVYISTAVLEPADEPASFSSLQSKLLRKVYPYFAVKRTIEDGVLDATSKGLRAVVVRPTTCLGPWDIKPRVMCWIPKLLCGEIPASLRHKINIMDTRDLAGAVATILETGIQGGTITMSGHNTTTDALLAKLCESGGVSAPRWGIPAALAIAPLLWTEVLWATVGSVSPLPSLVPTLLCEQRWVHMSTAQEELGVKLRSLAETAYDTVSWYRRLGYC
jgi:dihydroflavonol-4-reductase